MKPNMLHEEDQPVQQQRRAVRRSRRSKFPVQLSGVSTPQARVTLALAEAHTEPEDSLKTALDILQNAKSSDELKLEATRVIQLVFGDLTAKDAVGTVFEGYTFRDPPKKELADKVLEALRPLMNPTGGNQPPRDKPLTNLERELARVAAGLNSADERTRLWFPMWIGLLRARGSYTAGDPSAMIFTCSRVGGASRSSPRATMTARLQPHFFNWKCAARNRNSARTGSAADPHRRTRRFRSDPRSPLFVGHDGVTATPTSSGSKMFGS